MSDRPLIDPEVKKEVEELPGEDPFVVEYGTQGGDRDNKTEFTEKWFPNEDSWKGKTHLTPSQARAMAVTRNLGKVFEPLEDIQTYLDGVLNDYEEYLTSVEGKSREQQTDVLRAMFGGGPTDNDGQNSLVLSAMANPEDEDD